MSLNAETKAAIVAEYARCENDTVHQKYRSLY